MFKDLLKLIKKYNNIVIFRHQRPDGDAVFSSFAIYNFIKDNFEDKRVEMYGEETYDLLPYKNIVDKEFLKESLAIVLDTANTQRIDGDLFNTCKYVLKIDHHPNIDAYGDFNYVDDKACATCQIVAEILLSKEFSIYKLSEEVCEYLYCGILTDSLNFKTSNVTAKTFLIAAKLVEKGNLEVSGLSNYVFNTDIKSFNKITKYRNYLKISKGVGTLIANEKILKEIGFTGDEAKNNIAEFGNIKGLKIWCVFVYDTKTKKYNGSLRSKSKYVINELCQSYNGGGHKNACGVKGLTLKEVKNLIKDLHIIANKY